MVENLTKCLKNKQKLNKICTEIQISLRVFLFVKHMLSGNHAFYEIITKKCGLNFLKIITDKFNNKKST